MAELLRSWHDPGHASAVPSLASRPQSPRAQRRWTDPVPYHRPIPRSLMGPSSRSSVRPSSHFWKAVSLALCLLALLKHTQPREDMETGAVQAARTRRRRSASWVILGALGCILPIIAGIFLTREAPSPAARGEVVLLVPSNRPSPKMALRVYSDSRTQLVTYLVDVPCGEQTFEFLLYVMGDARVTDFAPSVSTTGRSALPFDEERYLDQPPGNLQDYANISQAQVLHGYGNSLPCLARDSFTETPFGDRTSLVISGKAPQNWKTQWLGEEHVRFPTIGSSRAMTDPDFLTFTFRGDHSQGWQLPADLQLSFLAGKADGSKEIVFSSQPLVSPSRLEWFSSDLLDVDLIIRKRWHDRLVGLLTLMAGVLSGVGASLLAGELRGRTRAP